MCDNGWRILKDQNVPDESAQLFEFCYSSLNIVILHTQSVLSEPEK